MMINIFNELFSFLKIRYLEKYVFMVIFLMLYDELNFLKLISVGYVSIFKITHNEKYYIPPQKSSWNKFDIHINPVDFLNTRHSLQF